MLISKLDVYMQEIDCKFYSLATQVKIIFFINKLHSVGFQVIIFAFLDENHVFDR